MLLSLESCLGLDSRLSELSFLAEQHTHRTDRYVPLRAVAPAAEAQDPLKTDPALCLIFSEKDDTYFDYSGLLVMSFIYLMLPETRLGN